ncbi:MAG: replication protein [Streptococcaceae bacterium]|nr:replication protein [Streptococcaceae bacterium]
MTKDKRSNKWAFLIYEESTPKNYLDILEAIHVPFILSPWHDKDINQDTGELKKSHKHGALFFDSLKSYTQVSELLKNKINAPAHVEIVMSPKGMYDYFTHAENPDKTPYNLEDIECGSGFELDKFLKEQNSDYFLNEAINLIETHQITEFEQLVHFVRQNNPLILSLIVDKSFFFAKFLDSKRHHSNHKKRIDNSNIKRGIDGNFKNNIN